MKKENKRVKNKKHDGFFRYVYSKPANAKTLLSLARESNRELDSILDGVDLDTLSPLSGLFSEVQERGESDLAFRAKSAGGGDLFVGILLEHKSYTDKRILDQLGRYAFNIMVNKNDTDFRWFPTKAIVIYNGTRGWDPLADFRRKNRAKFQGKDLPFEFALVNLSELDDERCLSEVNVEAAVGALVMKYAFDRCGLSEMASAIGCRLELLGNFGKDCFLEKINLYLGEFIGEEDLEELQMAFKSIGQRMGFVSAGDARRAAERSGRRAGMKKGMEKGMEMGLEKGMEKGMEKGRAQVIEFLRSQGVSPEIIARACELK